MPPRPIRMLAVTVGATLLLAGCTPSTEPEEPAGVHDVGVQLFEWSWNSIARECTEHLGPNGISWVLTSPPNEHIQGHEWWTSYQPVSYLVESRLGTREEFATMTATCAESGVDVIADAVVNHMTGQATPGTGWAGSPYSHYDYPGIYEPDDFHHCTDSVTGDILDYKDAAEVQDCELVNLADLDTASARVQDAILAYLIDLLDLGASGFRIDAAKHIPSADIGAIVDRLPKGTRIIQEVIRGAGEPITPEQYTGNGEVFEFGFARSVKAMVDSATLNQADGFGPDHGYLPSDDAVVFVDNHDTERNGETLNYRSGMKYLLANVFLLAQPYGTPVLYSGYAFTDRDAGPAQDAAGHVEPVENCRVGSDYRDGDWVCTQRWPEIVGMLAWRSAVGTDPVVNQWSDAYVYAFGRGVRGFVVLNAGEESIERTFHTSLAPGIYLDAISGDEYTVDASGDLSALVLPYNALALSVANRR